MSCALVGGNRSGKYVFNSKNRRDERRAVTENVIVRNSLLFFNFPFVIFVLLAVLISKRLNPTCLATFKTISNNDRSFE